MRFFGCAEYIFYDGERQVVRPVGGNGGFSSISRCVQGCFSSIAAKVALEKKPKIATIWVEHNNGKKVWGPFTVNLATGDCGEVLRRK